jgi:hypothetical protein
MPNCMYKMGSREDSEYDYIANTLTNKFDQEWFLINAKWVMFQLYDRQNKLYFDEMTMMFALY